PRPELERRKREVRKVGRATTRQEEHTHFSLEHRKAAEREMIEVHVRDEDDVERWEVVGIDARLDEALRELPHGRREDRISEHELVVDLNERRRMADPHDGEARSMGDWVLRAIDLPRALEERSHRPAERPPERASRKGEHARERRENREALH